MAWLRLAFGNLRVNRRRTAITPLLDLMRKLNAEHGITFVFSTHDPMVMERARRVIHLRDGRVEREEIRS